MSKAFLFSVKFTPLLPAILEVNLISNGRVLVVFILYLVLEDTTNIY